MLRLDRFRVGGLTAIAIRALAFSTAVSSVPTNITIDDDTPDPISGAQIVYGPNSPNVTWSVGLNCTICDAQPDPSKAFGGTWHDGTFTPGDGRPAYSATVPFKGTAVYVMLITIPTASITQLATLSHSEMTFQINGTDVGSASKSASVGLETKYDYNVPVFAKEGLPLGRHELTILNVGGTVGTKSVLLLDRIIYTMDSDDSPNSPSSPEPSTDTTVTTATPGPPSVTSSSPSSSPSTKPQQSSRHIGVIIGAVAALIIFILIFAIAIWTWRRRRARTLAAALSSTPFVDARIDAGDHDAGSSPPDYSSMVVLEQVGDHDTGSGLPDYSSAVVVEQAVMDVSQAHPTPFQVGQTGTKQMYATMFAAAVAHWQRPL